MTFSGHDRLHTARRVALVAMAVIAVDQVTKFMATTLAAGHTSGAVVPLRNSKFSLGLVGTSLPLTVVLCVLGIVTFGGYVLWASLRGRLPIWVAGFLLGGAVSNLVDRLAGGSVRDFLATPWVVLNLADLAVVAGLCGYLLVQLRISAPVLKEVKT